MFWSTKLDALAEVIGRTAFPFWQKYVVPAAKLVGADLLEIVVPEIADVVSVRKNFKTAGKSVERQNQRKQLGGRSRKGSASRVIATKSAKQSNRSRRDFSKNISITFQCQPFATVSVNLGRKVPIVDNFLSSHKQQIYLDLSLEKKLHRVLISNGLEPLR